MNDQNNLAARTRDWLRNQGYPLEMRVAKTLREASFDVQQTQFYKDSATEKAREIDLIALYSDYIGVVSLALVIECKASIKPWVLFTTDVGCAGIGIYWTYALMSKAAREALMDATQIDQTGSIEAQFQRLEWLKKSNDVAYAVRQAFTETDTAYSALTSCIKASSHVVNRERSSDFPQIRFAFPVVVIDAPLFLCRLNASFEPELEEVDSGEILFTNPDNQNDVTCVRIITAHHLSKFVVEAKKEMERLNREMQPAANSIWKEKFGDSIPIGLNGGRVSSS